MMRDQTLRGVVGCVAHEIKGELVMKFLRPILCYVVGNVFFRWDVYDAELILATYPWIESFRNPVLESCLRPQLPTNLYLPKGVGKRRA